MFGLAGEKKRPAQTSRPLSLSSSRRQSGKYNFSLIYVVLCLYR